MLPLKEKLLLLMQIQVQISMSCQNLLQRNGIVNSEVTSKVMHIQGRYTGSVKSGKVVTRATWYIVKRKNVEPLLSGPIAECLGIISFNAEPQVYDQKFMGGGQGGGWGGGKDER